MTNAVRVLYVGVLALLILAGSVDTRGGLSLTNRVGDEAPGHVDEDTVQRRDRYGVQFLVPDADQYEPLFPLLRELGVQWVRVSFNREVVHRGPQEYSWSDTDDLVARFATDGVQILAILEATPAWDTSEPGTLSSGTYPPRSFEQWGDYVFQTVSRYRTYIRHWEVWNEPDIPPPGGFWSGSPREYARLLATAYREIKRADPGAQVVMGGFLGEGYSEEFFRVILEDPENPAGNNFDILNIHAYFTAQQARDKVTRWRTLSSKPLWVTEVGWPAEGQDLDPEFCCGEEAQARFLSTVMPQLVELGADKVFWFALLVHENPWPGFDSYGLLDRSLRRRPAFGAFKDLLASLPP